MSSDNNISFRLELVDSTLMGWEAFSRRDPFSQQETLSRFIHITGHTSDVYLKGEEQKGYFAVCGHGQRSGGLADDDDGEYMDWTEFQCNVEPDTLLQGDCSSILSRPCFGIMRFRRAGTRSCCCLKEGLVGSWRGWVFVTDNRCQGMRMFWHRQS